VVAVLIASPVQTVDQNRQSGSRGDCSYTYSRETEV